MKEEERLKKEKQDMLGFYDYTVVLTYISLVISVFGMTRALAGDFKVAILCLALSGLCDMFDGKIARTKKDRTEDEKKFGIQIDSLCDVVCFGVFPALICYCLGMDRIPGIIILCLYCVASVIRLGYFNVMEEKRRMRLLSCVSITRDCLSPLWRLSFPLFIFCGRAAERTSFW